MYLINFYLFSYPDYLALGVFIIINILLMWKYEWFRKYLFEPFIGKKKRVDMRPWKRWNWDKPPENYKVIFYTDIALGTLSLLMTLIFIEIIGFAIITGYISLTCWIIAIRLFFQVRKLDRNSLLNSEIKNVHS